MFSTWLPRTKVEGVFTDHIKIPVAAIRRFAYAAAPIQLKQSRASLELLVNAPEKSNLKAKLM